MIWRRVNKLAVIQRDFRQRVAANEARRIEQSDDQPAAGTDAVAPVELTGVMTARHFFECG